MKQPILAIREGAVYEYTSLRPKGCAGCLYRVLFFVLDVPVYQQKVCVEAINGPDMGLRFVCSPANFASRYRPVEAPPPEERAVGYIQEEWRNGV